jgi:outer membrane protein
MKTRYYFVLLLGALLITHLAPAQEVRVAFVNGQAIYEQLPEHVQATQALKQYREQLQGRYVAQANAFRQKMNAYSNGPVTPGAAREVEDLYEQLKDAEVQNDRAYMAREMELRGPLGNRVKQAIMAVAREKAYSGVLDVSEVTYFDAANDITALVLQKLGITK